MKAGWNVRRLGDLLKVQNGYAFDSKEFNPSKGMPLIRIRSLKAGVETETRFSGTYDNKYVVNAGDLLIGMDGEFGCYVWKGEQALLNQRVCRLQGFDSELVPRFLFYGVNSYLKAIEDVTGFTTVKHISSKQILDIDFPIPSLPEQQRIVTLLDKAFDGIATAKANAEKNLQNARGLISIGFQAITERFGRTQWPIRQVESLAAPRKGAMRTGPFGSQLLHSEFVDEGIAVLGIDNAVANEFRWDRRRYITPEKYQQMSRYRVFPGDVLITIMGTCGRCAVVPDDIPLAINTKHLCCITLDRAKCLPEYLHIYFLHDLTSRDYLTAQAKGSIMAGLNMGIISELPVRLPSIEVQAEIVEQFESLRLECERLESVQRQKLTAFDDLKKSMLHRAFNGDL